MQAVAILRRPVLAAGDAEAGKGNGRPFPSATASSSPEVFPAGPSLDPAPCYGRSAHLLPTWGPRSRCLPTTPSCPELSILSLLKSFLKKANAPQTLGDPPAPRPARRHLQVHGRQLHPDPGRGHLRGSRGGSWARNSGNKLAGPRPARGGRSDSSATPGHVRRVT